MDLSMRNQTVQMCQKHNQPIILQDPKANKELFCVVCLQNLTGLVPPDEILKQQQELFNQQKNEMDYYKQQLQRALEEILNYKKNINSSLDKIIKYLMDGVETIDQFYKNQLNLRESGSSSQINYIENLQQKFQDQNQNNRKILGQAKFQLQDFQQKYCNVDQLLPLLDNINTVQLQQESRNFQYELKESSKHSAQKCLAFAFNKEGNILLVGCNKEIIIYRFLNGEITKELQRLTNHSNIVYCLYFMKKSNSFVSGSKDDSIIVWDLESCEKWAEKTQLKEHKGSVICICMNKNEDLLISGSFDDTVKFWKQIDNKWSCQQTIDLKDRSCSLSLNDEENKLISCGKESLIQIMQLQSDGQWSIVQQIQVCERGIRLGFYNGNQFVFQPKTKDYLELYKYDNKYKQFNKLKQIQVQSCEGCDWFFPIQFIQDIKIISVKHGRFLNIFKINDNGDIDLIQTIQFPTHVFYGILSYDGKYITTWDYQSKEMKFRYLQYLK